MRPTIFCNEPKLEIPERPLNLEEELRKLEKVDFKCGRNNYYLMWGNQFQEVTCDYKNSLQEPFTIYFTKESVYNFMANIKNKKNNKRRIFYSL